LVISGCAGVFVLAAVVFIRSFDLAVYKSRVEAAAAKTLGFDVGIGGRLKIGFSPGLHVTLEDVRVHNRASEIATVEEVDLRMGLLPLIRGRIEVRGVALARVSISVERGSDGAFNYEHAAGSDAPADALALSHVSLSEGTVRYADRQTGQGYVAQDCRLNVHDLRFAGGTASNLMKNLSFTAEGSCGRIPKQDFAVTEVSFAVAGKDALFEVAPVTMSLFGARGSGRIRADFSGAVPAYRVEYALPQFQIDELFKTLSATPIAQGRMNFSANLSMHGSTMREMRQTAQGRFALGGESITLTGRDLDDEFSRFESSQNFNLADVGALFFAGPFGLVVTKGYTFASLLQGTGGSSDIQKLVSEWRVERGIAYAQDVAMATRKNRIALHGDLDLVNERFDDVILAVIGADGCAKAQQKIHGTFQNPVVENPNVLESLAGSAVNLYKQGRGLFPGGACEVFYAGSVAAPTDDRFVPPS
jgi:uncharacterized protein involved in outer membrane biogenesis